MVFYVQLNNNNIVFASSQLKGKVDNPKMIELTEEGSDLLGKKYNNGAFHGLNIASLKSKIIANEETTLTLKWLDMEDNLVDDKTEITIFINEEEKTKVTAENGIAEVGFSSEEIGMFEIVAVCADGCSAGTQIEVIENE